MFIKNILLKKIKCFNIIDNNAVKKNSYCILIKKYYSHQRNSSNNKGNNEKKNEKDNYSEGTIYKEKNKIEKKEKDNSNLKEDANNMKNNYNDTINIYDKKKPNFIINFVLNLFVEKHNKENKIQYINEFKNELNKYLRSSDSNISCSKNQITFTNIFAILYLCYKEKIFDLEFLSKLSEKFDELFKSKNEKEILNSDNINYFIMFFYYFSYLNVKNITLNNKIKDFIINNEVDPLIIYKYLESLSLINDENNNITPVVQIFVETFYDYNNYLLLKILQFLHNLNYIDRDIFFLLTKKLNKNIYNENGNLYELCMLSRIYALYKKENITFFNYLYEDLMINITKYEDNFQNDENYYVNELENNEKKKFENGNEKRNIEKIDKILSNNDSNILNDEENHKEVADSYIHEIENMNRDNYFFFKNSLYNDGLNFYPFFISSKTTNKECFKTKQKLNINFTNNENKSKDDNAHISKWNKMFFYEEYKMKDIKNEKFVNCEDNKSEDEIIEVNSKFLKENLYYEFSYEKLVEIFVNISNQLDNLKIDINKKDVVIISNYDKMIQYKKKLLFIENYYIGHIFHIIDSMLSLNIHHNCAYFDKLKKKILNLIKNNESYIIDNFDSNEIKSLLIFLAHINKYYKESFIYCITHRMVDLYINGLCKPETLSIFFYNLLSFTKKKIVKKNRFNHTIRNTIYNSYFWLNDNKNITKEDNNISTLEKKEISNIYNNIKVKNHTLLQLLSIYICKNVYFISLPTLASLLRSLSYLSFNNFNFYNVFIPLFLKHIENLKNVDILNITQAYNKQKIKNKYFYYLLSKQYQNNYSNKLKNSEPKIKLIG
ncbi:conserved Plasmodium protein, unknown function [Plasmodium gallinaceum]|uniref:Uncharacterized protein n=1 Tax=Plasmodium gallinaceum TaxID=5849 RepID=A0A1J1GTU3_PLAGA|nr:conserved Plasmodium protein, unknown function [Plasmodium gallinaceum]CRG95871.1 conserved Plasmodium protein, unknown function [Plasmodium gallinaceum]